MNGAIKARPGRYANKGKDVAANAGVGYAPRHFSREQKRLWKEITAAVPAGALISADKILVEMVVRLLQKLRSGALTRSAELNVLISALSRLGMTPADRAKLEITPAPPAPENDPWAALFDDD